MMIRVKVCGLSTDDAVDAAVTAGAAFVGFVFFPASPRHVDPARAGALARRVPPSVKKVGVFVDADDATIAAAVTAASLDILQLHGQETPGRARALRAATGRQIMKAIAVERQQDLDQATRFVETGAADLLLFDAKPPANADRTGGHARRFDWTLLDGRRWPVPWLLAGGLTARNLAEAVRDSGAGAVDVSSGVERRPGEKDPTLIRAFLAAAGRL